MRLVTVAGAWIAGIVVASRVDLPLAVWAVWLAIPAGLLVLFRRDASLRTLHIYLLVFVLAALRYTAALPQFDQSSLAAYNDRSSVTLRGMVAAPPDRRDATINLRLAANQVCVGIDCRDISGMALLQVPRASDIRYGDVLQVTGMPATPFESPDFSYKDYLARQGIHSVVRTYGAVQVVERDAGDPFFTALYAFRERALATVYALFPEPAAALVAGILLGDDSGIPRDLEDAFRATNTAHIIAISGFNISVLAAVLFALARRVLNARYAALVVIPSLLIYTLLVGASPSVVRAAIMAGLSLLALYLGRQNDALNALAFVVLVMTALDPFTLYDMSFLLSASATLGLVLYADPINTGAEAFLARIVSGDHAKQIVGLLADSLLVTIAAQITSTPILVFAFHRFSLVGLVSNLLVLPVQPAVEIWGGLATITGLVVQPVGQVMAWIAWPFVQWTVLAIEATAHLPWSSVEVGRFDVLWLGIYYVLLFGITRVNWRALDPSRIRIRPRPALAAGAALVAGIWLWNFGIAAPDGKTHVIFLDVDGPAALVRTPAGRRVLIDGGASPSALLAALGEQMPFWERSIDVLVLSRPDDDHLAGLVAALERYDVGTAIQGPAPSKTNATYAKWRDLIAQKQVTSVPAQSGTQLVLDQDVALEIVYSGETGEVVARLRAGTLTFAFAEGIENQEHARNGLGTVSTVVLAPAALAPDLSEWMPSQYAILASGQKTRSQPAPEAVASTAPLMLLSTAQHGTIEMITDGQTLAVRTER